MFKKSIVQKTLQTILAFLSKITIWRYKPLIIGITGSVGKTSTKEAVFCVLKRKYRVRRAEKNYNNEIGLPLTILGIPHYGRNILKWFSAFFRVIFRVILRQHQYPEILVLEYGIDRPRDMDYLLSIAKPDAAVITAIGEIPVHVEFFAGSLEVAKEKAKLIQTLPINGQAILNADDEVISEIKNKTKAKIITFGFYEHANIRIMNHELTHRLRSSTEDHSKSSGQALQSDSGQRIINTYGGNSLPEGVAFKIEYQGKTIPIRLNNCFGKPQVYSAAAAIAVGLILNINLVEIAESLTDYLPPPGRLRLLKGIKNSLILDDTYNASPQAVHEALDVLESLPATRRIVVLGDMMEIGKFTEYAHRAIGDKVAKFADILFAVGSKARFIADEAGTRGIEKKSRKLNEEQIFIFDDAIKAGKKLDKIIKPGDLILVKGSQSMRMEKAVEEIMAEPERAKELLVRQDKYWK